MSYLVLLILVALIAILYVVLDPRRRGKNLPPIVGGVPFLGSLPKFSGAPVQTVAEAYKKHGDCFTLHIAGFNMTFLIGPKAHEVFFRGTDEELSPKEAYQFMVPVFGKNVVYDSPTPVMYEQLRFIKSGLVVSQLRKNVPIIEKEARTFFETWGESGEIEFLDAMNRLTILTASRCLLGPEIRDDPKVSSDFARLYHDLEGGLNAVAFFFPNLPIPAHRRRDQARIDIQELFSKVIKQRRQLTDDDVQPDDMLQILMDCEYKSGEKLDDHAITGMLVGILFAGQHTSGITATWTCYFLQKNKEYLKELLEEQEQIKEEFGSSISFDSLKKSVKLENAVRESLRMFPPLIMLMRKVMKPLSYREYDIPVGDLLAVAPGVCHRIEEVYSNCNKWDPSRFDRGEHLKQNYSFLSFGGGRHGCPGENFGILQIKTIWTVLLREFDLELVGEMPEPDYTNLVVGPKPTMIRYKKKKQQA